MLAYGTAIGSEQNYRRFARPAIERLAEPDSVILARRGQALQTAYNDMLVEAGDLEGLEGLVLIHEDVEVVDSRFAARVRGAFADPLAAVLGVAGASDVTSLAWWEGEGHGGRIVAPQLGVFGIAMEYRDRPSEVDAVDGLLLVLSPWAVRELRFDADLAVNFHGYDVDFCFQARARGRKVLVDDFAVVHHTTGGFREGRAESWIMADVAFKRKWGLGLEGQLRQPRRASRRTTR